MDYEQIIGPLKEEVIDFIIGQKVECYDPRIWAIRGHDLNHNEDCWKTATIIDVRFNEMCCEGMDNEHIHNILIDVEFDYDGYISRGHFLTSIRQRGMKK